MTEVVPAIGGEHTYGAWTGGTRECTRCHYKEVVRIRADTGADDKASYVAGASTSHGDYVSINYAVSGKNGYADGHTLVGVYATYTSGPLNGIRVTLDKQSEWVWQLPYASGNYTLFSTWKAKTFTITYDLNGMHVWGTVGPTSYVVGYGPSAADLYSVVGPNPEDGSIQKSFNGWMYNGVYVKDDTLKNVTGNITLVAGFENRMWDTRIGYDSSGNLQTMYQKKDGTQVTKSGSGFALEIYNDQGELDHQWDHTVQSTKEEYKESHYLQKGSDTYWVGQSGVGVARAGANTHYVRLDAAVLQKLRMGATVTVQFHAWVQVRSGGRWNIGFNPYWSTSTGAIGITPGFYRFPSVDDSTRPHNSSKVMYTEATSFTSENVSSGAITLDKNSPAGFTLELYHLLDGKGAPPYADVQFKNMYCTFYFNDASVYTVNFNPNGGTGGSTQSVELATWGNNQVTLIAPQCMATKEGHWFKGWNTDALANPETAYVIMAGERFSTWGDTRSLTLYAIWVKNKYTVAIQDEYGGSDPNAQKATVVRAPTCRTYGTAFDFTANVMNNAKFTAGYTRQEASYAPIGAGNMGSTDANLATFHWTLNGTKNGGALGVAAEKEVN